MFSATDILVYAWIGWITVMIPTAIVLYGTSYLIAHIGNVIYTNLKAIYRLQSIDYYFEKMENEGTHAFKLKDEG